MRLIIVILKTESSLKLWSRFQEKQRTEIRYMPKIKRFKRFKSHFKRFFDRRIRA